MFAYVKGVCAQCSSVWCLLHMCFDVVDACPEVIKRKVKREDVTELHNKFGGFLCPMNHWSSQVLYIYKNACVYTHKIYLLYMICACSHTFLDLCLQVILIYMCLSSRYTYGRFLNTSTTIYGIQIWYLLSTMENWINGSLPLSHIYILYMYIIYI